MERQKWTDHKFNQGIDTGWTQNILSNLKDTAIRIEHYSKSLSAKELSEKEQGKWSIKEHIGHLIDLEKLWMNRFQQFENGSLELVAADMSNTKTENANHNKTSIDQLLDSFKLERKKLIAQIQNLNMKTQLHEAFHPRLKIMMRPVDLLSFISEHDNHHMVYIQDISGRLRTKPSF